VRLYRRLEPTVHLLPFRCIELADDTFLGHVLMDPLVMRWLGNTMASVVTRWVPPIVDL
jgi:hypothetical protein